MKMLSDEYWIMWNSYQKIGIHQKKTNSFRSKYHKVMKWLLNIIFPFSPPHPRNSISFDWDRSKIKIQLSKNIPFQQIFWWVNLEPRWTGKWGNLCAFSFNRGKKGVTAYSGSWRESKGSIEIKTQILEVKSESNRFQFHFLFLTHTHIHNQKIPTLPPSINIFFSSQFWRKALDFHQLGRLLHLYMHTLFLSQNHA